MKIFIVVDYLLNSRFTGPSEENTEPNVSFFDTLRFPSVRDAEEFLRKKNFIFDGDRWKHPSEEFRHAAILSVVSPPVAQEVT